MGQKISKRSEQSHVVAPKDFEGQPMVHYSVKLGDTVHLDKKKSQKVRMVPPAAAIPSVVPPEVSFAPDEVSEAAPGAPPSIGVLDAAMVEDIKSLSIAEHVEFTTGDGRHFYWEKSTAEEVTFYEENTKHVVAIFNLTPDKENQASLWVSKETVQTGFFDEVIAKLAAPWVLESKQEKDFIQKTGSKGSTGDDATGTVQTPGQSHEISDELKERHPVDLLKQTRSNPVC